jgi:hypothetical protein
MESTVILCYCPWRSHTHCLFSSLLSRSFTCSKFDYHGFEHGFLGFFRVRFFHHTWNRSNAFSFTHLLSVLTFCISWDMFICVLGHFFSVLLKLDNFY